MGHYAQSLYPDVVVRYVNSEEFTNEFINSVQSGQFGKAQEFQRRYRDIDILLIDDIQFLQRAPETMEAFFHTFNTLYNSDKQIVTTSDLPPKELGGFEDRMRSRFEMGLMTDVQPPDLETQDRDPAQEGRSGEHRRGAARRPGVHRLAHRHEHP